jgi:hypothetical protein
MYQDYLGVKIDEPSHILTLQPKLPDHITSADFTVYTGTHPVHCLYARGTENSRIVLFAPDLPSPMKVRLIWMLDNGDAWRGTVDLPPNVRVTVAIGADDVLAYVNDDQVALVAKQKLTGFSQRKVFGGMAFAAPVGNRTKNEDQP